MARTASPTDMSISDLERLLRLRQRELDALMRRRKRLERKLAALDERLARLEGPGGGRHRGLSAGNGTGKRARNEVPLTEAIERVLGKARGPLSVGEIVAGVLASGYRSMSANFRGVVN